MTTTPENDSGEKNRTEFTLFAAKRIVLGAVGIVLVLWLVSYTMRFFDTPEAEKATPATHMEEAQSGHGDDTQTTAGSKDGHGSPSGRAPAEHAAAVDQESGGHETAPAQEMAAAEEENHVAATKAATGGHAPAAVHGKAATAAPAEEHAAPAAEEKAAAGHGAESAAETPAHGAAGRATVAAPDITGVAFVDSMIAPMDYELNERFYGWRPNDIIEWTDNVNNYQLGILEVTRRTAEVLADRISRTGSTQAFEKELEKVRSNFNINADQYWLPSAEKSYAEALELLESYKQKLMNGTAYFYNRSDNLIPLLRAYENLLGSCDDNLIKTKEDDGSDVSWFRADNYFFYAKGVASAMETILEAVAIDFARTIETRRGTEVLHHALEALHHATSINPLLITDSAPDGILANHRANMAGPISHARFYIGLLAETLST